MEEAGEKPEVGQKLNRPATITLFNMGRKKSVSPEAYEEKLRRKSKNINAKLLNYNDALNQAILSVEHFTKYGLDDSDDEEEEV